MDDVKTIKPILIIEAVSIVGDTKDAERGEASIGYNFTVDCGLPELAFALAQMLKSIDTEDEFKATVADGTKDVGTTFIALLVQYYKQPNEPDE